MELVMTYLLIRSYIFLRKTHNYYIIKAYTNTDYYVCALIFIWTLRAIGSFLLNLYFFIISDTGNDLLNESVFIYYRFIIWINDFGFSTFLLYFLYVSSRESSMKPSIDRRFRAPIYDRELFPD